MSLLKRPTPWLKPGAIIVTIFVIAAPALASPEPDPMAPDRYPKVEDLPALAAAGDPATSAAPPPPAQGTAPSPAPGQFKVDKDAAQRALERTLVVEGALLLPFGLAEIQPSFSYTRSEVDDLALLTQEGERFFAQRKTRQNIFSSDLFLRFGLPFDSQLEFGIPYQYIDTEEVADIGSVERDFGGHNVVRSDSAGFGDFQLALAKGLLREGLWWPNLIARVTWDSDSGRIPLGSGFNELTGELTATKRQDPLVFIGSLSYTTSFEKNDIEPGDQLGFSVGAILAASPETSLRLILDQTFVNDFKIGGRTIKGTDQTIGSLNFGASSVIGDGKFLDFTAATGLTDQAPDYSVEVTFVVRFDVPGLPF